MEDDLFVGRTRELGVLERWLVGARAGDGGVVLVDGEPGMGKTALGHEQPLCRANTHVLASTWGFR